MTVRRDDKEPARYRPDLVIGREELFADARAQLARGGSVLLHGPAGIGKSTVLRALAAENAAATSRVLRCSATESESHLPFLALADLFGLVLDEVAPGCPSPSAPPWSRRSRGAASPRSSGTAWRCGSRCCPRCARCPPRALFSSSPTTSSGSTRRAPNCSASPPAAWGTARCACCARCARRTRSTTATCAPARRTRSPCGSARSPAPRCPRCSTTAATPPCPAPPCVTSTAPAAATRCSRWSWAAPSRRAPPAPGPASRSRCRPRCGRWSSAAWRCCPTRPAAPCWWPAPAPAPPWPCCTRPDGTTRRPRPPRPPPSGCSSPTPRTRRCASRTR